MQQLAGAVAAAPENSLHWHQERLTCQIQIVLAVAAPEAVAENPHTVESSAQHSDDRTAEHVAEAARSLAASEARGRELLQNTEVAGRLGGDSAARNSLVAFVPGLREAAVAEQESAGQLAEYWPEAAGLEAAGSPCTRCSCAACSLSPSWLERLPSRTDVILGMMEDSVILKRSSMADL